MLLVRELEEVGMHPPCYLGAANHHKGCAQLVCTSVWSWPRLWGEQVLLAVVPRVHMAVELAGAVGECLVHPELVCAWWLVQWSPGMSRVCWTPAGCLGHNLPCAETGNGTTPAGQMSSLMVLGMFTREDVCLWAEQWLIACPLAAPVLMETQLSLLLEPAGAPRTPGRLACRCLSAQGELGAA